MYNEFEFWYPYYRLKEAGAEVVVVGSGTAFERSSWQDEPDELDYMLMHLSRINSP